jgi:hypothetical protein
MMPFLFSIFEFVYYEHMIANLVNLSIKHMGIDTRTKNESPAASPITPRAPVTGGVVALI